MESLQSFLGTAGDLLIFVFGFSLLVVVHELGHFLAARWAGIRVLAFAVGFGPAVLSHRRGLGWRLGSSEREYLASLRGSPPQPVSPTEYRLNWFPFGGYVKMLGQEDLNPGATSDAPDSYQSAPVWKRMVVISAGVVMNLFLAAILFAVVFSIGLSTEPPKLGFVAPGSPAARATPHLAGLAPGLQPGDQILEINSKPAHKFDQLVLETAMTPRDASLSLLVKREGVPEPIRFELKPTPSRTTGLLEIGVAPAHSTTIFNPKDSHTRAQLLQQLALAGVHDAEPGMTLTSVANRPVRLGALDLEHAAQRSEGQPFDVEFASPSGRTIRATITPTPQLQIAETPGPDQSRREIAHLAGFVPVMRVRQAQEGAHAAGLRDADVFARLGNVEYPSFTPGLAQIQSHKNRAIPIVVQRQDDSGNTTRVSLDAPVNNKGQIGFLAGDTANHSTLLALPPASLLAPDSEAAAAPPAFGVVTVPGTRVLAVADRPVSNFADLRQALLDATPPQAFDANSTARVPLTLELPRSTDQPPLTTRVELPLTKADRDALAALGWDSPLDGAFFETEKVTLRGGSPVQAVAIGFREMKVAMLSVYVTFIRLFADQTVKVEHLKGPVGIAHIGTLVADRGLVWLLFFLAMVSVNLAVVNFLPLPIVDGGQFLLLLYESLRGKPAPAFIQNGLTLAGLVLIGSVFLLVTFHDVKNLFGL